MAVIEVALGLTGDMSGLLGTRQTLIVEGGDDALILYKLSGILRSQARHISRIAFICGLPRSASKTPMYAAFAWARVGIRAYCLTRIKKGKTQRKDK